MALPVNGECGLAVKQDSGSFTLSPTVTVCVGALLQLDTPQKPTVRITPFPGVG